MPSNIDSAIGAVYRSDWGRIIAALVRLVGDFDVAKETTQQAFCGRDNRTRGSVKYTSASLFGHSDD